MIWRAATGPAEEHGAVLGRFAGVGDVDPTSRSPAVSATTTRKDRRSPMGKLTASVAIRGSPNR